MLARDTSLWADDVWVVDSTPVECARSREPVHRSALAGWAEYGYCATHSRHFWGLRLGLRQGPVQDPRHSPVNAVGVVNRSHVEAERSERARQPLAVSETRG
jgi:hypothetical protein